MSSLTKFSDKQGHKMGKLDFPWML